MKYRLSLIQCNTGGKDAKEKVRRAVSEASMNGTKVVLLPEMWNCPYSNGSFHKYAEPEDGESVGFMKELAKAHSLYIIGGSIPERSEGKVYNTAFIFDPAGDIIGKHRKAHLFDIDIKGGIRFMESETLTPGNDICVVNTEYGKIGVAICYDVRFPGMFKEMRKRGAELIVLPAAFNMTTGPAHWDILIKARALDNQIYFAACSPARNVNSAYTAYGHSCVINPWGEFCAAADANESIIYADIDTDFIEKTRHQVPILTQERPELFD